MLSPLNGFAIFGGRLTPPLSPPKAPATPTVDVDDYAPCPPTPHCVPANEDEPLCPCALSCSTAQPTASRSHNYSSTAEPGHLTRFTDPVMDEPRGHPGYQARHVPMVAFPPHVSDRLLYACELLYASPSPVLIMIQRATLDRMDFRNRPVLPSMCDRPFKLFSFTAGHVPHTGLFGHDTQSAQYYSKRPFPLLLRQLGGGVSYRYPVSTIEAVQRSLRMNWFLVYPSPIPIIIIRPHDIIGPFLLTRRADGFAFVVPSEDYLWPIIRQRGVDSNFRPLNRIVPVETQRCYRGGAMYSAQHIVASDFAVNVFLRVFDHTTGAYSHCDYLGAYVLQVKDNLTMNSTAWAEIKPEIRHSVCERISHRIECHPGIPYIPYVWFSYYKWDRQIVGLADEIRESEVENQNDALMDYSNSTAFGFDTGRDNGTTPCPE